jgi:predicted permease
MRRDDERWDDVDAELRFHFEERVEELVARGLSHETARRQADSEFGDVHAVRSGLVAIDRRMRRRRRRREALTLVLADLRHAARRLRRSPGFLFATVLTLALGIGAVTAVFGTVDAIALRMLPYPSAERLVRVQNTLPGIDDTWALARGQFLHYREHARGFDAIGLYRTGAGTVRSSSGDAAYARIALVNVDLPRVLSLDVSEGRLFREEESLGEGASVVIVAESFRRAVLGGAHVLGSTLELDGRVHEIVGVLDDDVRLPEEVRYGASSRIDLWVPLALDPAEPAQNHHVFRGVGMLRDGITLEAAHADLASLVRRFPETLPTAYSDRFMEETGYAPELVRLRDEVVGGSDRVLWILLGAVCVVLLITCANVANLFLVRADGRRREMTVRTVLGAGAADLARHRLAETLMVTSLAGLIGIALAWAGMRALVQIAPPGIPRLPEVGLTPNSVALALGLSLCIGIVFGLLPSGGRGAESRVLAEAGRSLTLSRGRRNVRNALVAAQIGLCFTLLAGAGVLLRSFAHLTAVEPGFETDGVLTFNLVLPSPLYPDAAATAVFYERLSQRIAALPGVSAAGGGTSLPLGGIPGCTGTTPVAPANPDQGGECLPVIFITPGYFEALGIAIVRGTAPDWTSLRAGARVAIPSAGLARYFWGSGDALDQAVIVGGPAESFVSGVAADLANDALDVPPVDVLYIPILPPAYGAITVRQLSFVVKTTMRDPLALVPAVRTALRDIDPSVPLNRPQAMTDIVATSMSRLTFTATLLALAALMALIVGAVGIYGVISCTVSLRRAEIGIRVALGAHASHVRSLVLGETLRIALIGIVAGVGVTVVLGRFVASLLYGVRPVDPLTLAVVAGLLIVVAALAGWIPAMRARRVDPLEALRSV